MDLDVTLPVVTVRKVVHVITQLVSVTTDAQMGGLDCIAIIVRETSK